MSLTRIALIIALLAGLAAAGLNIATVRTKITTLQTNLSTETAEKTKAQDAARTAKANEEKAVQKQKTAEAELATSKDEHDKAIAEAEEQKKQAAGLSDQLRKTKQSLEDSQAELAAWSALGLKPDQIKEVLAQLKQSQKDREDFEKRLKELTFAYGKATNELARYRGESEIQLPPGLEAKVVAVDPKWDFVVLNVGQDQGALEYGQMLVSRKGKLVAKVRIERVDRDQSIANVMPGWKLSDIMEGDLAVVQ